MKKCIKCGESKSIKLFDKNVCVKKGNYYEIILENRQHNEVGRALIDINDYKKVKKYRWCMDKNKYTLTSLDEKRLLLLHRLIMPNNKGLDIDHINHNPLDNRKKNLRAVTHQQNMMNNKSKGYSWDKTNGKWQSAIRVSNKLIYLGRFNTEEEAITARKNAKLKYFKEFANF